MSMTDSHTAMLWLRTHSQNEVFSCDNYKGTHFWDVTPCINLIIIIATAIPYISMTDDHTAMLWMRTHLQNEVFSCDNYRVTHFWDVTPCSTEPSFEGTWWRWRHQVPSSTAIYNPTSQKTVTNQPHYFHITVIITELLRASSVTWKSSSLKSLERQRLTAVNWHRSHQWLI
jgi:hypothetical protein